RKALAIARRNQARVQVRRSHRCQSSGEWDFRESMADAEASAVGPGGAADDAVEGADEVGEVLEADLVGNLGDGTVSVEQHARGKPTASAEQVLMRRHAGDAPEDAQEMEGAEPSGGGELRQGQGLATAGFDAIDCIVHATDMARVLGDRDERRGTRMRDDGLRHQVAQLVDVGTLATPSMLEQGGNPP